VEGSSQLFFGHCWWIYAGESIRRFAFRLIWIENRTSGCVLIAKLPVLRRPTKGEHCGNRDAAKRQEDKSGGNHRQLMMVGSYTGHRQPVEAKSPAIAFSPLMYLGRMESIASLAAETSSARATLHAFSLVCHSIGIVKPQVFADVGRL
jgi:hypothetical protein